MSELWTTSGNEENWMSISDLMAGLMVVFLFLAIAFVQGVDDARETLETKFATNSERQLMPSVGAMKLKYAMKVLLCVLKTLTFCLALTQLR